MVSRVCFNPHIKVKIVKPAVALVRFQLSFHTTNNLLTRHFSFLEEDRLEVLVFSSTRLSPFNTYNIHSYSLLKYNNNIVIVKP